MTNAIYPGSFDPIHLGHMDIIRRAVEMFDKLYVAVDMSSAKGPMFDADTRFRMTQAAVIEDISPNRHKVEVVPMNGLLVDLAILPEIRASVIVRGLRNAGDMGYEQKMAFANRALEQLDTCFLVSPPDLSILSSSLIREILRLGRRAPVLSWVPKCIAEAI